MLIRITKSFAPAGLSALRKGEKFNAPDAVATEQIEAGVAIAIVTAAPAQKRERATLKAHETR
jgi:hypothetical protein